MKSSLYAEEDDFVPELQRSIHPRERPDWEETLSAMARGADIPDISGELPLRTCGSTASMKVKNVKKLSFTKGHFPKMAECAHFHYENVDFGNIQLSLPEEQNEVTRNGCESKELVYLVQVSCQGKSWIVKRSYEDFRVLDKHLHLCIYDRRFSQLSELPRSDALKDSPELVTQMLMAYLSRLSSIAGNKINCGPALTWMEIDNKGNHLLVHEESSINVPAIAAAHVIKRYIAQAADELSFEVGDIVSVIDMPPKELTTWWRGKHGFQVGFFPSECVELINDKVPQSVTNSVPKPVSPAHGARPASWSFFPPYLEMDSIKPGSACVSETLNQSHLSSVSKKHGKLITFLRTFMKSRPTKQKLKQRGILKERVFGCDLGEHLLNSGHDVPQVLKSCTEFIEKHGIVDGIYRLSGIASNIQKLRHEFDSEQIPDLTKDVYIQDIHCVGSLCKLYFRELPNPLLTYQLYEKFSDAVSAATDEERLVKIHDVIQQLPPPHYRTLEFLMRHLAHLADYCAITNMHTKNLAIVWAPNLLRSKQIESACFSGTAAFMEVRIQSVVVEFILNHVDVLFSCKLSSVIRESAGHSSLSRPKSLLVSSPSTKLLTLEEAQARTQAQINSPIVADSKYIEVGEGPAALQGKFHTIIDFPSERKRPPSKMKKSPVGSWRSFFNLGKSSSLSKRKLQRNPSEPSEMKAIALAGGRGDSGTLRSAKSEESLSSLHAIDGESKLFRPRRPRSSSDALSASFNGELLGNMNRCNSYDNLPHDQESDGEEGHIHVPALISPRSAEDVDLSPPEIGVASLDFDPMSFQCSPPKAESECFDSSTSVLESVDFSKDKQSTFKKDLDSGSQSQTPGSATSSEPVSPYQEKAVSPFFMLDLSPTEDKSPKPRLLSEKVGHAFSPNTGQKPPKSPPPNILEPVCFALPSRVPDVIGGLSGNLGAPEWTKGNCSAIEAINRSPPEMIISPLKACELRPNEGHHEEFQSQGDAKKAEQQEEVEQPLASSSQSKPVPSGQTQPGVVALDSPQDPVPVSSVSVVPPPPPKNAARLLALALAESAQQASVQSNRKPDALSDCISYAEAESGGSVDMFHTYSDVPPEKLHLYAALPENQLSFQAAAPGVPHRMGLPVDQGFTNSGTPEGSNRSHAGKPGHRDHSLLPTDMPGELQSSTDLGWDHSHFQLRASGEAPHLTHSILSEGQNHPQPCTRGAVDPQPPVTEAPTQNSHSCLPMDKNQIETNKLHFPACAAEHKYQLHPAAAGEKTATSVATCMITIPTTAAETEPGVSSQHVPGHPATAVPNCTWGEIAFMTAQRALAASHAGPNQRPGEHQPAVGQAPATVINPFSVLGQAQEEATPEKLPEPRSADPAPVCIPEGSAAIQCTSATPVATLHQVHLEKPRENVRAPPLHLHSESVPAHSSYGFMPPVPPVRTIESKIAAAMHSNSADLMNPASYHSFLASSALPSSVEDTVPPPPPPKHASLQSSYFSHSKSESPPEPPVLDNCMHHKPASIHQYRAESIPPYLYHNKSEQHPSCPSLGETPLAVPRYNAYPTQGKSASVHHSKPRSRVEYMSSMSPTMRSNSYVEETPPYPSIRRVHSVHVTSQSTIRSVPISRTEVPPDDEPLYCPRPVYQYKPYHPHADYHVTQLQPYFENGRVHYRYSPYSSSSSSSCYTAADGGFYDLDPYGTMRLRQFHPLSGRDFASYSRMQGKGLYRYPGMPPYPRGGLIGHLTGKEHSFISRDVPPAPDVKPMYASWDLEDMEKYRMQSIRRESRARQKVKGPVMSQYDNVAPSLPDEWRTVDVVHLRSKSDPGKTGLLTVADGKEGRYPCKVGTPEGDECYHVPHLDTDMDRSHYHGTYGNGPSEKPSLPQKQSSIRNRKSHEAGCNSTEHRTHLQHDVSHRLPVESKNGPPYADYRPKGPQEPLESTVYQHSGGKYVPASHDALRLNHKEVKLPEDRPEAERPRARQPVTVEKHSRDCYKEGEHYGQPAAPPPKPERSHSLRLQHPESVERDPSQLYPYQTLGKRQSTMTVVSQYDNLDDYHTMPQHQRGGYVSPFSHPHSRTYATALGQGAFLPSELCLQRPETEIHAE
ncbi:rho GTPase-activating protein 32 isoform X2 [Sphaerodactylus townsendi]|uniref:rho GTPase-activating protein 32 isoform X2 n=1 Tax=Sphaerodactylus townsendi TaxID=933632 RepID=UPI002025BB1C|nr:rho GTPase-activating protein 32 isoform X2 [Sphaerodactylus townsendi]